MYFFRCRSTAESGPISFCLHVHRKSGWGVRVGAPVPGRALRKCGVAYKYHELR